MFGSFIEGFFLGIGAAVPIGPINILIMNQALSSYSRAVAIGAGAMSADLTYLTLLLIGLIDRIKSNHILLNIIGILGAIFLLYLAYGIFRHRNIQMESVQIKQSAKGILGSYLKGYTLTLLNPYTIGFWLSVAGYVATQGLNPFLTVAGLLSAILLWITLMPLFVHKSRHLIKPAAFKWINIASSIVLAFFGVSMLLKLAFSIG